MSSQYLRRISSHYQQLTIANKKVLSLFRMELRKYSLNTKVAADKHAYNSDGQETNAMSTINEQAKQAEFDSQSRYSRGDIPKDLQILFQNDKEVFNSVKRGENFFQKFCTSNKGWTISNQRESIIPFDRIQPVCTDFQHE